MPNTENQTLQDMLIEYSGKYQDLEHDIDLMWLGAVELSDGEMARMEIESDRYLTLMSGLRGAIELSKLKKQ